ncbi:NAD-dependent dehydratase [Dictyobacter alpinus]|uniref:NAD-dependent dehydratase n=1 Tax=Dictyobacter alpinus TaxID=2014873 RepID=A0A402BHX1_9CHLR|nr:NAD-dependent epimerase/dehydratase family protein [Dictyobacter alpinus]GCE30939.1 NAD-dependent dehydratase [Dictyobacter alpinus]
MRYFVTGATGFVGSHVVRQLIEGGHEVVAIVRNPAKAQELTKLGVTIAQGDVTNKESMREPMRNVDGVFHIAGWYKVGIKDKSDGEKINIQGICNVLELMKELGIKKGVYTSTLAVNSDTHGKEVDESYHFTGKHLSEYDRTKWVAHYEVADPMIDEGLPLVIVLPGVIYGPEDTSSVRTTFIQYLQRKLPMLPGETTFSWAHVEDIARGHILAMEKGNVGESYIIAGPTHSLVEAMNMAQTITGIPAPRRIIAPGVMKALSAIMSIAEKVIPVPDDYSSEYLRVNGGTTYIGTNAKARRELGYEPRSLKEGLTQTLQHEMQLLGMK